MKYQVDGLVQDCSNWNALELLQSCTKPRMLHIEACDDKILLHTHASQPARNKGFL